MFGERAGLLMSHMPLFRLLLILDINILSLTCEAVGYLNSLQVRRGAICWDISYCAFLISVTGG